MASIITWLSAAFNLLQTWARMRWDTAYKHFYSNVDAFLAASRALNNLSRESTQGANAIKELSVFTTHQRIFSGHACLSLSAISMIRGSIAQMYVIFQTVTSFYATNWVGFKTLHRFSFLCYCHVLFLPNTQSADTWWHKLKRAK